MAVTLGGMTLLTTNDAGTGWAGTDGIDTYGFSIQGANSESWQLSKNATETGTLTASAAMPAVRGLYTVWMASSIQAIYTSIDLALQSSAGNSRSYSIATTTVQAVDGAFKAFAFDYVSKGTPTGTFAPASLTSSIFTIVTQNINFRAIPNNWIDTIHYGAGHTIAGTTVSDKVFTEAASADIAGDFYYGILENFSGVIFSQGDIDLTGTALVSNGETLVFKDTANGYDTYNFDVTGTATFTNTSIVNSGAIDFIFDSSGATAFTMTGGSLVGYSSLVTGASQTISEVVFQAGGDGTIANTISSSNFNICGQQTLTTGSLSNCTINKSTATSAVVCSALANVVTSEFISSGTGHAIELTSIGGGSMTWDSITTGYTAGATGSPVTPTSTGNESLYVNVASGTLTINVDGGTVPSIRSAGATINVVAGLATLTLTGLITGSDIIINTSGTNTPLADINQNAGSSYGYSYTYVPSTFVDIKIMLAGYLPYQVYGLELTDSTIAKLPIAQAIDRTYV